MGLATGNIGEGDRSESIKITSGYQYVAAVKDKCDLGLYLSRVFQEKWGRTSVTHVAMALRKY